MKSNLMKHGPEGESQAAKVAVVTRDKRDQASFQGRLFDAGYQPVSIPTIAKRALLTIRETREWVAQIPDFDWVIFTSPFAVDVLARDSDRTDTQPAFSSFFHHVKVAAVGPATSKRLNEYGITVHCIPNPHSYPYLPDAMGALTDQSIFLPRSKKGAPELIELLEKQGAQVTEAWTYTTENRTPQPDEWENLPSGRFAVLFSSGTTVRGLHAATENAELKSTLDRAYFICIGPSTANVCQDLFGRVDAIANPHTEAGLIQALKTTF